MIADYGRDEQTLLYVDPPYLASTRRETRYLHEMATVAEHEELAEALHRCQAAVALSGYRSPLYAALYPGWTCHEIAATTDSADGRRIEVVWLNRADQHLFSDQKETVTSPTRSGRRPAKPKVEAR